MRHAWILAACSIAIAGCVTKPPRPDQLRQPPADRLLAFQSPTDGDATIVVTRDVGMSGSGCYGAIFIDGKVAAKVATGERATFHVPAGEHIVGTWNTGSGLCGYREGKDRREVSTILKPGDEKRFRITINPNSGVEITPTTL
ncbi:hypothetical protein [Luteibacter sp. SG786]|uniref:hypothetical protein n=1 Tax=Luteibacter sp. SG786 TaxID=2587130 RepID=UPI001421CB66|nr:hypothetical protein [Luteibacter sp. SG786]NII53553.1 hypothetical protein [Luteibacter sp. SG786]